MAAHFMHPNVGTTSAPLGAEPLAKGCSRWYDLDPLVKYHMLIGAVGLLLTVTGVYAFSWRLGLLAAGVALMVAAWLMAKSAD